MHGVLIQNREITHPDVTLLVRAAEDELTALYPEQPLGRLDAKAGFVVAYRLGEPVGCGALTPVDASTFELNRMYVLPAHRRTGVAKRILAGLIRRAVAQGATGVILETGVRQPAAVALYEAAGFERTEPYGQYADNPFSVCFFKKL